MVCRVRRLTPRPGTVQPLAGANLAARGRPLPPSLVGSRRFAPAVAGYRRWRPQRGPIFLALLALLAPLAAPAAPATPAALAAPAALAGPANSAPSAGLAPPAQPASHPTIAQPLRGRAITARRRPVPCPHLCGHAGSSVILHAHASVGMPPRSCAITARRRPVSCPHLCGHAGSSVILHAHASVGMPPRSRAITTRRRRAKRFAQVSPLGATHHLHPASCRSRPSPVIHAHAARLSSTLRLGPEGSPACR